MGRFPSFESQAIDAREASSSLGDVRKRQHRSNFNGPLTGQKVLVQTWSGSTTKASKAQQLHVRACLKQGVRVPYVRTPSEACVDS